MKNYLNIKEFYKTFVHIENIANELHSKLSNISVNDIFIALLESDKQTFTTIQKNRRKSFLISIKIYTHGFKDMTTEQKTFCIKMVLNEILDKLLINFNVYGIEKCKKNLLDFLFYESNNNYCTLDVYHAIIQYIQSFEKKEMIFDEKNDTIVKIPHKYSNIDFIKFLEKRIYCTLNKKYNIKQLMQTINSQLAIGI